jgi:SAM-dependent methyltransferase
MVGWHEGKRLKIDHRRGALFESAALDYDQYRPGYPNIIVNEVVSLSCLTSSSRLLEIGCGTGKATVQFASRGYMIDCIDPGRRLVSFAKRNCRSWPNATFNVGRFEEMDPGQVDYDLVLSAQAFHWVDPRVRLFKVTRLLKSGGSLALLYNYPGRKKDRVMEFLTDAIREESGGRLESWDYIEDVAGWKKEIADSGLFCHIGIVRHRWMYRYSAETYAGLFRTYSDFLSLPRSVQKRVLERMRGIILTNGGSVHRSYDSILIHARKR